MDKFNELQIKLQKANKDYDDLVSQENDSRRALDQAISEVEKKAIKKKREALLIKMAAASKKEDEIARQIDELMRNR